MKPICLFALGVVPLVSGLFARPAASANPPEPLDLQAYTGELSRWSASASRLSVHPEEARALRKQLPDHWSVAVQEQRFLVSTEWLAAALDRLAANPKLAKDTSREMDIRLNAMLQDSQCLVQTPEPNSSLARSKLNDILKRREFRSVRAAIEEESLWDRLVDWVWTLISRLFRHVGGHPAATQGFLWGVVIVLGLAFLGWLVHSLTRLSTANLSFRRLPVTGESAASTADWQKWAQEGHAAAERGEYRDAVRITYGAAVRRIAEAGFWQIDPSRTHREYVRLLPAGSSQRPHVAAITNLFEGVWYGHEQASAAIYESARAELESL